MDVPVLNDPHAPVQYARRGKRQTILGGDVFKRSDQSFLRGIFCHVPRLPVHPDCLEAHPPHDDQHVHYAQPLVAATLAILMSQDTLTWDKPIAALLVFTGVYLVTQSKSRADLENEGNFTTKNKE